MKRSFQGGSLVQVPNRHGFSWVLRYNEKETGKRKALTLGTHIDLPTEFHARLEAAKQTAVINSDVKAYTVNQLVAKFRETDQALRVQTVSSYGSNLKYIEARWGDTPIPEMLKNLLIVQDWLSNLKSFPTLTRPSRPLSKKTKQNVKALLHRLIQCAMLWGYMEVGVNPVALVEIKTPRGVTLPKKRLKVPISVAEYYLLINDPETASHVKVMMTIALFLGMRISEILALRWDDIDLENGKIDISHSVVGRHLEGTKTDASESSLPLHPQLVLIIKAWAEAMPVVKGWVFGSVVTGRPFHRDSLQADHLAPAGKRVGIDGLGWHTFRHTYITLLRECGTQPEVQMMLMRHADMRTTNGYGRDGGNMALKRVANTTVIDNILSLEAAN